MRKVALLTIVVALAVSACWPFEDDAGASEDPVPTTTPAEQGPAFVDEVEFVFLESYPVQVRMTVRGNLPTPCHEAYWNVAAEEGSPEITVEVFSVTDPGAVCAAVLEPFEVTIDLGSYPSGEYTVDLNGATYSFTV